MTTHVSGIAVRIRKKKKKKWPMFTRKGGWPTLSISAQVAEAFEEKLGGFNSRRDGSNIPTSGMIGPKPRKGTKARVIGPIKAWGMDIWRVFDVATAKQIGPDCFSIDEARERCKDFLSGKKVVWFGQTKMTLKKLT